MKKLLVLVLPLVMLLTGCPTWQQRYNLELPDIQVKSVKSFTLGVQDERDYVKSGEKPEKYTGFHVRFGTHDQVYAADNQPLADVFASRIKEALALQGVEVTVVRLPLHMKREEAVNALVSTGQKSVLITLHDWKSISVVNAKHFYDLDIAVFDRNGKTLAARTIKGTENLGNDGYRVGTYLWRIRSAVLMQKIEELFGLPQIADEL